MGGKTAYTVYEGSEAKAAAQPKCWPPRTLLAYSTRRFLARLDNPNRKPYREDVPTILRERGFRFFFYMADKFEPPHVHVQREDCAAKLWLDPLEFAFVEGFRRHEANDILHITEQHRDEFLRAWYKTFGDLNHE